MENLRNNQDITNGLISAVREGNLEKARELINSYGLSYSQEWSQGYILLCEALRNKHAAVAKLLLANGAEVNGETKPPVNTPLHFAVINGDIDIFKMILDKGADVEAKNEYGRTPLHVAVEMGYLQIVEHLLDYGADINCRCIWKEGYKPLHFAVEKGNTEIITLLLNRGANVNVKGQDGITPLHVAAKNGNIRIAEDLLNHGAWIHSSTFKERYTPLHIASELDDEEAVKFLLNRGADINARTKDNSTPLHVATKKGCKRVVEVLLEHINEFYNQAKNGKTILQFAVEEGHLVIVEDFLKKCPDINNQSNRSCVKFAVHGCRRKYERIVKALLQYGLTVNPEDATDPKLLHAAVEKGYLKIVEDLLKYGADINASDEYGRTALHFTVEDVANIDIKVKIAKLLLSKGANVNAQANNGETTLHTAIGGGHVKVVEALLEYNANVNCEDEWTNTPLHLSVKRRNEEMSIMLLNKGANVHAKQEYGTTALHIATQVGSKEIVRLLLERGAKVDCKIEDGMTPLHMAAARNHQEIIKSILEYGADIDSRDRDGITALHIASQNGHSRVVEILLEYGSDINITCISNHTPLDYNGMAGLRSFPLPFGNYGDNDLSYYTYHRFSSPREAVAETLQRHIVKMTRANLYVSEQNLLLMRWSRIDENFQDECEKEVASMKSEEINDAKVSFYDILVKDTSSLARYMRNENIVQVLKLDIYKTKYPIYASMIKNNFRKGMERKELLERGIGSLDILFNDLPKLTPECLEKIINYFSDEDLRNLIDACKLPGINDPNANDVVIP